MKKITMTITILALCLDTAAMMRHTAGQQNPPGAAFVKASAPYRDGMYLGRLAAEHGRPPRAPIGRWSRDADRSDFAVGFERGYRGRVSSRM